MPDPKRFLSLEAVRRISRLELRARYVVEGFLSGMHRSPYFGQSVEFRQHREYTSGDDLRNVDWKVWAKQDRLYVKQYEEDANLRCTFLCDVSNSMKYGNGPLNKYEYGCTVAACLAYLSLRQQDAVGCIAFDADTRMAVPQRTKKTHLDDILQALDACSPTNKTDLGLILRHAVEEIPRRGLVVLISDLLAPREGLFKGLKLLRSRGHDVIVFHILDDDELDFSFNESTRFEGLESDAFVRCNPRALREGYLEALNVYLDEVRRGCAGHNVDYVLLRTRQPLEAALSAFLSHRLARLRM